MKAKTLVPLVRLRGELEKATGRPAPTHRRLWTDIINNRLPAEKIGNQWWVDLNAAIRALGLDAA